MNDTFILTQYLRKGKTMKNPDWESLPIVLIAIAGIIASVLIYNNIHKIMATNELPELTSEPIVTEAPEIIEKVPEVPKEAPAPVLSDEDIMAAVVMAEAGNQEMIGKVAVAMVILNRCDYWGMTVESVVNQEGQFAYPYYGTITEDCYTAVRIAQENRELFPDTMLFFRNTKFHDFGKPYLQLQSHFFSLIDKEE